LNCDKEAKFKHRGKNNPAGYPHLLSMRFFLLALLLCPMIAAHGEPVHLAAYYFPNWGAPSDSEWGNLVRAQPKFPGHLQPKYPLWGMQDEREPEIMAQKIDAAADHGLEAFIFCWYAFDGPKRYLDDALRKGFLQAANRDRVKFALMWANHDVEGIGKGKITPETWEGITNEVVSDFFLQPNYWRVNGSPYFSMQDPRKFVDGFGSVAKAAEALRQFRKKAVAAGLPGIHLNAILYGTTPELAKKLGFDSLTSYVWIHHQVLPDFPTSDYAPFRDRYFEAVDNGGWLNGMEKSASAFRLPYFPNVTMGWDASPRCPPDAAWENKPYPFGPVLVKNTPAEFKNALQQAVGVLDRHRTKPRIITIYAWNEWGEGGYLEPEYRTGMGYLEALRDFRK